MDQRVLTVPERPRRDVAPPPPTGPPKPCGGRPRVDGRRVLGGPLYRLHTDCEWRAIRRSAAECAERSTTSRSRTSPAL